MAAIGEENWDENIKARLVGPRLSSNMADCDTVSFDLNENDIPGACLEGRKPVELKNDELKFWLRCRGDPAKGLKTKAELVKRYGLFIVIDQLYRAPIRCSQF